MKSVIASTLIVGTAAVVTETHAHDAMSMKKTSMKMSINDMLMKAHPNATVMLRKGDDLDTDAWESYQAKYRAEDPAGGAYIGEGSAPVTQYPGAWDGLGGKFLTPGPVETFAADMKKQCMRMDPGAYKYNSHTSIQEPYHSDFMQGWGLTATIEAAYGHLIITDQHIMLTMSCTNVVKQTASYGYAENQCCATALKMCCAAHVNYEVMLHQLGYKYAYACQGLTGFPFGEKEFTMKQCLAQGDQSWVAKNNVDWDAADKAN